LSGSVLALKAELTPKKNEVPLHLRYPVAKGVGVRGSLPTIANVHTLA